MERLDNMATTAQLKAQLAAAEKKAVAAEAASAKSAAATPGVTNVATPPVATSYNPLSGMQTSAPVATGTIAGINAPAPQTPTADRNTKPSVSPGAGNSWQWISLPGKPGTGEWRAVSNQSSSQNALGGVTPQGTVVDNTAALAALAAKQAADQKAADAQNAFVTFKARFTALGLGSLADAMVSISTSANPPTTDAGYYLALLDTPEYKTRFGDTNAMRIKNGLPALSEADIMKSEENIRNTMRAYNMPAGFYDQPQDLQTFIALDKSAAEVGDIIKAYQDIAKTVNPDTSKALETYYGIGLSGITAALMDPTKAQPVLNAIAQKGTSAAAAASAGVTDVAGYAQVAQGMGAGTLDYAKQAQAFAQAQSMSQQVGTLSNIYSGAIGAGSFYNTAQAMQETLGGPEAEQAKLARERLTTQELSSFGGSAGASQQGQSLGIGTQQGVQ